MKQKVLWRLKSMLLKRLKPGEYEVIYTVSDRHKNKAEAVLKLKVNAKTPENSQDSSQR